MMEEIFQEFILARNEQLERICKNVPVGKTLCVHEVNSELNFQTNTYTQTEKFHILEPEEQCRVDGSKVQYGPMPEGLW